MFSCIKMIDHRRTLAQRLAARKHCGPYQWTPTQPGKGRGFYQARHGLRMDDAGSSLRLRLEEANDHIAHTRLAYTKGYYCDLDGDGETLRPIIARLPSGRGFLAGWTMGEGMCAALDATRYDSERDAALAAHDLAERDAERSRDEQEREREQGEAA